MNDLRLPDSSVVLDGSQAASSLPKRASSTIYPLQYLRAIAAFSVVLCHASYYVKDIRGDGRMWEIFDRAGYLGVVLFFAISGYLMAQLAEKATGLRFLAHRLIRIYPIYWLCVFTVLLVERIFREVRFGLFLKIGLIFADQVAPAVGGNLRIVFHAERFLHSA